jgi:conjugal transfer ATP-binding protein TraC
MYTQNTNMPPDPLSANRAPTPRGQMPSYTPNIAPVFQSASLGNELQQNNTVRGAYGTYNPNQGQPQAFNQNPNQPKELNSSNIINTQSDSFNSVFAQNQPQRGQQGQPNYNNQNQFNQNRQGQYPAQNQNNVFPQNRQPNPNYQPQVRYGSPQNQNQFQGQQPQQYQQRPQQGQRPQPQPKQGFFSGLFGGSNQQQQQRPQARPNPRLADKNSPTYLKTLSSSELRKEVIQTEIEIQKTLLETDKNYKKDITTIRDLIAPSSVSISGRQMELGTKIVRSFFVLTYSRIITSGWLEGLINADIPLDLSIYIYPEDSTAVLKDLRGKVGKIQASLQINAEKGMARDPALETAYRDVEALRDAIAQGVEKFFKIGVYIQIYADTQDQLERNSQFIESMFDQQNIIIKRAALQMDDGFNACLPILRDDLYVYSNMNTSPLSACFPFVSSDLSSNNGILYGINRHNSSLVIFDRFDLENANSVVFATTGAGKSYTVKLEILRSLMMGTSVIVIDPEQEYKMLANTVGGAYINFSLNSTNRINPFDLPKALPGENTADILRSATIDLIGLINLMLGKMTPQETSVMERAIMECYAKRDITPESNFSTLTPPTMSDLVEILNGIIGGESLAQRLYRYTEGTFAGIFNRQTNINIYNEFVVFNIRDLQEELRPIAMYVLLKYVWNEIRTTLKRRVLVCDEAWIMMQYEDSAKFLFGLVKRARKYYLGVTTITQDVSDFLNSPWGKPIVTNAAMKILLKQSPTSIDLVGQTFNLTTGEKQVLLESDVGQGIFFAGTRHVAIGIIAFPTEHQIITTNPQDILKMQGLEEGEMTEE